MKNKQEALDALKTTTLIDGHYLVAGKPCAVGLLARLSGVPDDVLNFCDGNSIPRCPQLFQPIEKKFGLHLGFLSMLQCINDQCESPEKRHVAVTDYIKSLKEE